MATTEATRRNRTADRNRLPLTPKVTAGRRGAHQTFGRVQRADVPAGSAATPAFHLTPNVVIASRGDVRNRQAARGQRSLLQIDGLDLRRFRA